MFLSLKLCIDFHQILKISLPQEDLELIRSLGYLASNIAMATLFTPQPLRAVGVLVSRMVSGWAGGRSGGLTFDPCFKVKWGHRTKKAIYLLYVGPRIGTPIMSE